MNLTMRLKWTKLNAQHNRFPDIHSSSNFITIFVCIYFVFKIIPLKNVLTVVHDNHMKAVH